MQPYKHVIINNIDSRYTVLGIISHVYSYICYYFHTILNIDTDIDAYLMLYY